MKTRLYMDICYKNNVLEQINPEFRGAGRLCFERKMELSFIPTVGMTLHIAFQAENPEMEDAPDLEVTQVSWWESDNELWVDTEDGPSYESTVENVKTDIAWAKKCGFELSGRNPFDQ